MMGEALFEALRLLAEALASARAQYALIGGAAMPVWGHDRSTRDVDAVVLTEPGNEPQQVARIVDALRTRGFAHMDRADRARLEEGLLVHAWFPLRPQSVSLRIDLFLAGDPHRVEVIRRARPRMVGGCEVPVASCEDLILLKCRAARPVDMADARALVQANSTQLDQDYLRRWAAALGLADHPWEAAAGE